MLSFKEFYFICEGKKKKDKKGKKNKVSKSDLESPYYKPGTHEVHSDLHGTYQTGFLQRKQHPIGKPSKKEIKNLLSQNGPKAVKKYAKKRDKYFKSINSDSL